MRVVTTNRQRLRKVIHPDVPIALAVAAHVRSGHHAILDWLVSCWPRQAVHFNHCFANKRECRRLFFLHRDRLPAPFSGRHPLREDDRTRYVVNFEGTTRESYLQALETWRPRAVVLVLRDPFNAAASFLHKTWEQCRWRWQAESWIWLARVFAGEDSVPHSRKIDFNQWVQAVKWTRVHPAGRGSSFTGPQARHLKRRNTLRRWRQYINDEPFRQFVLRDREVMRLARILYPRLTEQVEKAR